MIKELILKNFRCFDDHTIPLNPLTVIVGRNNAGKSTIVEALRLVSIIASRYFNLMYKEPPKWLNFGIAERGVTPALKTNEFNFENVFNRYGKPPAVIQANYSTGESIKIYIGADNNVYAQLFDAENKQIKTKAQANKSPIPAVNILPQISPLLRNEKVINADYVKASMSSHLSSHHFRNQLTLLPKEYKKFKKLAEETWHLLRILDLRNENNELFQLIQDGDFVAEAGWMGHGLQMWLQTMWFLARVSIDSTIILDEPDVYMHADLQRKLIRMLKGQFKQTIIATHSIEIMAEVEPDNILVIDRSRESSYFASTLPAVQRIITQIGSVHNINLTRLWTSKKFLLVEGDDIDILKKLQNTLFPNTAQPFDTIPSKSLGGWGGWDYALASSLNLKNASEEKITIYCIFDRDYHTSEEIVERLRLAKEKGVELHIWSRKEIENYLIIPEAIVRIIKSAGRQGKPVPSTKEVLSQIEKITDNLYHETLGDIAEEIQKKNKGILFKSIQQKAVEYVKPNWESLDGRLTLVSGKKIISALSKWSQEFFGVSISSQRLSNELRKSEICPEMHKVIESIEINKPFFTSK